MDVCHSIDTVGCHASLRYVVVSFGDSLKEFMLTFINTYLCVGLSISAKQATMVMGIISVIVLMYLLSHVFWWTLFSSGFLISLHLLLRDASMHKDEGDKIDMTGDLDLDTSEDAAFLNPAQIDQV